MNAIDIKNKNTLKGAVLIFKNALIEEVRCNCSITIYLLF